MEIERLKEAMGHLRAAQDIFNGGPLDYYLRKLTGAYEYLLTLSPFKVGDRVQLADTPTITPKKSWGWMPYKHYLVKGSIARVATIEADEQGFSYELQFENASHIDHRGVESIDPEPIEKRGTFYFRSKWIEVLHDNGSVKP